MSSDRYRGESRGDDRGRGGARMRRSDAPPGAPRSRDDERRPSYETDSRDRADGAYRTNERPRGDFQADGEPYERSDREVGSPRGRSFGLGYAGSPTAGGRGDFSRPRGAYDGAQRPRDGGGYGEYNYRDELSPRGVEQRGWVGDGWDAYGRTAAADEPARGRFTGKGPKGYVRSDDRIREDVSHALERHGDVDASEIEVIVSGGEVTLEGTVLDRSSKRLAEDAIEDLPGVKHVHNRLRVDSKHGRDSESRS